MCTNSIGGGIMSASGVGKNFQNINDLSDREILVKKDRLTS